MTRIFFWNVQRLGKSTDPTRATGIKVGANSIKADLYLFCELTKECKIPPAQILTYRALWSNPSPLCYGCVDGTDTHVPLGKVTPTVTAAYQQAKYPGGKNFKVLADRAPGCAGLVKGVYIYVIHAPARTIYAERVMAFLACYLDDLHKTTTPWLAIGDFNVQPQTLMQSKVGINLSGLMRYTKLGEPTFIGNKGVKNKRYDYALTNIPGAKVSRIKRNSFLNISDHYPIVAEW